MKRIILVALALIAFFISAVAHGEVTSASAPSTTPPVSAPTLPSTPPASAPAPASSSNQHSPRTVSPHIAETSAQLRTLEHKSCREYLTICERSCAEMGGMLRFSCIGQEFQPFDRHFLCKCADDFNLDAIQILK